MSSLIPDPSSRQTSTLFLDDASSYRDLRKRKWFDRFTVCWGCRQPPFICPNRSCACDGSPLIWQVCWTLAYLDIHHGSELVHLLGGSSSCRWSAGQLPRSICGVGGEDDPSIRAAGLTSCLVNVSMVRSLGDSRA